MYAWGIERDKRDEGKKERKDGKEKDVIKFRWEWVGTDIMEGKRKKGKKLKERK